MISIGITSANKTYTISQFIALKDSDNITYPNFSVLNRSITNDKIVYCIDNLLYSYTDEIDKVKKICTFTVEERLKYMYKPKLLSYDIYGSTEAYFIILAMNGMCNVKEFDLDNKKLYLLLPKDMSNIMSQIASAESTFIKLNRETQSVR